jgi:hypothetical protein
LVPPPQAQFQTSRAGEIANAPIRTGKHNAKNFLDAIKDDSSARFSGDSENSEGSPVLGCLLSLHLMPTSSRLDGTLQHDADVTARSAHCSASNMLLAAIAAMFLTRSLILQVLACCCTGCC